MSTPTVKKPPVWALVAGVIIFVGIAAAIIYQVVGKHKPEFNYDKPGTDFTLQNIDGKEVSLTDTNGKARLVYFYFASCPDVCQPTNHFLSQIQNRLIEEESFGKDTAILSITFDPERDTTEALQKYASLFQADLNGWYFLRGEEQYTLDLARKWEVGVQKQDNGDFVHTNIIFLVDKTGQIRHYYNANQLDLDKETIVKDLLYLAKE